MPSSSLEPSNRIVVSKDIVIIDGYDDMWQRRRRCNEDTTTQNNNVLNLMMICCEENQPYGPPAATATMFLELLCTAYEQRCHDICNREVAVADDDGNSQSQPNKDYSTNLTSIRITIYHAQSNDYPTTQEEWNKYNGIIIPGSLSAAYDTHIDWIYTLQTIIQSEIVAKQRKCLGVCFGHQCFAHSFEIIDGKNSDTTRNGSSSKQARRGSASKCTTGNVAGRKSFKLTNEGKYIFGNSRSLTTTSNKDCIDMLFTRGDMVESLPSVAVSLCGSSTLPNEACAYFAYEDEVYKFQQQVKQQENEKTASVVDKGSSGSEVVPYAITFQAHPEYMTSTGYKINYVNTVKAMKDRGSISTEQEEAAINDAKLYYEMLERDCLDATVSTAVILGWF